MPSRWVKSRGSFDHLAYWRRSLYAAAAAKILSEEFHVALQEEAFLASLLMDIGMLALDRVLGKEYGATVARANSHDALAAIETQALGITHAEVAGVLADRWKLPEALSIPMTHHHTPHLREDSAIKEVAQIVWLAGRCADVFDIHAPPASEEDPMAGAASAADGGGGARNRCPRYGSPVRPLKGTPTPREESPAARAVARSRNRSSLRRRNGLAAPSDPHFLLSSCSASRAAR